METPVFKALDIAPLAAAGQRVVVQVPLARLPRLAPLVEDASGDITAELDFSRREDGALLIRSRVTGTVPLTCQRCLGPMEHAIDTRSGLIVVASESAVAGVRDENLEPVVATDGQLILADLVEEELLLALPAAAKHENQSACAGLAEEFDGSKTSSKTHRPFEKLKDILH